jgi:DNA-binding GntR family transcriptional regulator
VSSPRSDPAERHAQLTPLAQSAYEALCELLAAREASDEPIREADVVRRLGIGRTPVREALHRLEAEGLLRSVPGGGYQQQLRIDENSIREVFEVHSALEQLSARLAAERRRRVNLAYLEDMVEEGEELLRKHDLAGVAHNSEQFHHGLAAATHSGFLQETLGRVHEAYHRFWLAPVSTAADWESDLAESRRLLDALQRQDAEAAVQIMSQKMDRVLELRLAALHSADNDGAVSLPSSGEVRQR